MPMERQSKVALIGLGIVVLLASLWWGYRQWQHQKLAIALHDPDPVVRMAAVRSAGKAGQVGPLLEGLSDENPDIRLVAAQLLGYSESKTKEAIQALLAILKDDHAGVRREGAEALYRMLPEAAPALYNALEDNNPRVRSGAALAFDNPVSDKMPRPRVPGERETIIPLLTKLLEDKDEEVRHNANETLEQLNRERTGVR